MARRALEFGKDLSGYSAVDNYMNAPTQEGWFNPKLGKAAAAIGSYGLGRFMGPSAAAMGEMAGEIGGFSGNALYNRAARPISEMAKGGRLYEALTPEGKALAATRIMTPGQISSAQKALLTVAGNTADFGAKAAATFSSDAISALARQIANKSNMVGAGIRWLAGQD